ncbi:G protein-coupled receptor, rhodopsin-like family and GPCR, rhodopsin-like, 7TM domain-containing protein [Strongyloides ratti]|uniref:G protein-coupled receptor, rhodopsin-like family and GPCR, rhodopsin-like, 7TM domain-containing protein n=1 Tax=Strongyloides ratti TaxID=34506 RepID=A0A090L123_STRRB|nr:G protein-coupled receptor, rhodopsin-like family and GPCR, rhodopsin-like, 7TM domain-containing protein [Strongyloides ratti]CEF63386.1 G protein-coupled receptor, rhodopsin-like family and GPCR, rhodopsin-like, 7TM domain-containing protein [Strongyloides ratti]
MAAVSEGILADKWNACSIQPHKAYQNDELTIDLVWWTNAICLPTIAIIGITCNLINIFVLTYNPSSKRIPSRKLLLILAICDIFFLFFAVLEVSPMSIRSFLSSPIINEIYTKLVLYIRMCASTFYKSSVLLVVIFNIERYISVCYPLRSNRLCSHKAINYTIILCIIFSFICSLHWPLVYEVTDCYDFNDNHEYFVISMSENSFWIAYYRTMDYFSLFTFNIFPIVLLFYLNYKLIMTLRKVIHKDLILQRQIISSNQQTTQLINNHENNFTQRQNANKILFAVVAMLFICVAPQAPARLLYEILGHYHPTAIIYTCISQQLVFLNASLNFCLYCLVSRRYRSLLIESFRILLMPHKGFFTSSAVTFQLKTRSSSVHAQSSDEPIY